MRGVVFFRYCCFCAAGTAQLTGKALITCISAFFILIAQHSGCLSLGEKFAQGGKDLQAGLPADRINLAQHIRIM